MWRYIATRAQDVADGFTVTGLSYRTAEAVVAYANKWLDVTASLREDTPQGDLDCYAVAKV